jgi:hypothetical protein
VTTLHRDQLAASSSGICRPWEWPLRTLTGCPFWDGSGARARAHLIRRAKTTAIVGMRFRHRHLRSSSVPNPGR